MSQPHQEVSNRISGLDSVRFICAMFVVFAHLGFLPLPEIAGTSSLSTRLVRGVMGNLFPGPPAVIVFFIVSGFCIHYPFRRSASVPLAAYFVRRYARIGLPLLAGILVARWLAPGHPVFDLGAANDTVVWSLVAEIVYYSLYPVLLPGIRRFGWKRMLLASYGAAFLAVGLNPSFDYYLQFGPWVTWVVGLPSWLLGCWLAETLNVRVQHPDRSIWWWRLGVWFCASASSVLLFHAHLGYPWTLPVFSWLCAQWLKRELVLGNARPQSPFLEWAGQWSYSLYLLHLVVAATWLKWGPSFASERLAWMLRVAVALAGSYVFYLLVELPAHRFARWLSRKVEPEVAKSA